MQVEIEYNNLLNTMLEHSHYQCYALVVGGDAPHFARKLPHYGPFHFVDRPPCHLRQHDVIGRCFMKQGRDFPLAVEFAWQHALPLLPGMLESRGIICGRTAPTSNAAYFRWSCDGLGCGAWSCLLGGAGCRLFSTGCLLGGAGCTLLFLLGFCRWHGHIVFCATSGRPCSLGPG
jgi:hypothetical protein